MSTKPGQTSFPAQSMSSSPLRFLPMSLIVPDALSTRMSPTKSVCVAGSKMRPDWRRRVGMVNRISRGIVRSIFLENEGLVWRWHCSEHLRLTQNYDHTELSVRHLAIAMDIRRLANLGRANDCPQGRDIAVQYHQKATQPRPKKHRTH